MASAPGTTTAALKNGVWFAQVDNITAKLEDYKEAMQAKIEEGLRDCAGELMDRSVKICPYKTGELRSRSFKTDVMKDEDGHPEIYVGYERFGAKTGSVKGEAAGKFYAVPVHERTYAKHEPPGQAKFLECARNEYADEFKAAMKKYVEEAGDEV